jgi:hypothetical protein
MPLLSTSPRPLLLHRSRTRTLRST